MFFTAVLPNFASSGLRADQQVRSSNKCVDAQCLHASGSTQQRENSYVLWLSADT